MRFHASRSGCRILVLGLLIALGCTGGTDSGSSHPSTLQTDVLVARSTDGGATWTAPSALNAAATEQLGSDAAPQVTTDTLGTWIAAWHSSKLGSLPRTDYDILMARSTDNGATWRDHAELNTNAGTDEGGDTWVVQLVTDEQGIWVAIWQSWNSLGDTIGTDGDIHIARSANDGLGWTDPTPLNTTAYTDTEDDKNPQLTTDGAGNWVAVWYTTEGYNRPAPDDNADRDILFARSMDDGANWTDPAPLNTNADDDPGGDSNPQITTDGATWIAIWELKDVAPSARGYPNAIGPDADILCARSIDAGATWTDPAPVNSNATHKSNNQIQYVPGDDRAPQLATDGSIWIAVWYSRDTLASLVPASDRIGNDTDILFARSLNDGATWTDPAPLNNNAVTDNSADSSPTLTTDGTTWFATWISGNTLGDTIGDDVDILMARSTDGGVTWTDPEPLNANADNDTGDDNYQQVTTDGQGNWVATWHATDWP